LLERTTFQLSDDEKQLYQGFDTLTPGEFRMMLKRANWHTGSGSDVLTTAGKKPENL
jgi:hypothetical protein